MSGLLNITSTFQSVNCICPFTMVNIVNVRMSMRATFVHASQIMRVSSCLESEICAYTIYVSKLV